MPFFAIMFLMKIGLIKTTNNGKRAWMLQYQPPGGKRKRLFFKNKEAAETEQARLWKQQNESGAIWVGLSGDERNLMIALLGDARQQGVNLREAFDFFVANRSKANPINYELGESWDAFYAEKKASSLSVKTLYFYKSIIDRFVEGRESVPLVSINRDVCMAWLKRDGWKERTFNNYLTGLKVFFNWCVDVGRLDKSPVEKINKIKERNMADFDTPPKILTVEQCQALLDAAMRTDKGMIPYVALGLFAGLRPEREARMLEWADMVNGFIRVKGPHVKSRKRRYVPINDTLAAWLKMGGDLPVPNKVKRFLDVRLASGIVWKDEEGKLMGWKTERMSDCLRHTFASNFLALYGVEKTIAAMGHVNHDMLFNHYRELVTEADAKRFWAILPPS